MTLYSTNNSGLAQKREVLWNGTYNYVSDIGIAVSPTLLKILEQVTLSPKEQELWFLGVSGGRDLWNCCLERPNHLYPHLIQLARGKVTQTSQSRKPDGLSGVA